VPCPRLRQAEERSDVAKAHRLVEPRCHPTEQPRDARVHALRGDTCPGNPRDEIPAQCAQSVVGVPCILEGRSQARREIAQQISRHSSDGCVREEPAHDFSTRLALGSDEHMRDEPCPSEGVRRVGRDGDSVASDAPGVAVELDVPRERERQLDYVVRMEVRVRVALPGRGAEDPEAGSLPDEDAAVSRRSQAAESTGRSSNAAR